MLNYISFDIESTLFTELYIVFGQKSLVHGKKHLQFNVILILHIPLALQFQYWIAPCNALNCDVSFSGQKVNRNFRNCLYFKTVVIMFLNEKADEILRLHLFWNAHYKRIENPKQLYFISNQNHSIVGVPNMFYLHYKNPCTTKISAAMTSWDRLSKFHVTGVTIST